MVQNISQTRPIVKYQNGKLQEEDDEIVTEFPITIHINGEEFATMVCTPTHLEELVIGFLASEGVILFKDDIADLKIDESQGFAYVTLKSKIQLNQQQYSKRFIGSCCGKSRQFYFQNDVRTSKTSMTKTVIKADECINLMNTMQKNSLVFKNTGGVHNAALCNPSDIIVDRTDIGRHNALDKLYGHSILNKIPVRDKIIVFSGRISSEVLTKAAKIGVGIVLSKSAPTDLAIQLAEDLNITTVGFIRGQSFNVYSHAERISSIDEAQMS
ncbi:formate dehydrogenase accessory sulfurtransferase FdhD [Aquibacillus sp. 3ASR75-11]|uniref:Sulfur carrier protein FdhD n=1 Tax=Terrihalobacillus insolitus TaxID=2950438 RepID=A0A9X3WSB7_9BACI|nr:formate dehydrogenase accessory sulfurtransferase FdhD [Terrihalobacillus insolitus]MDC3413838.1 formate dehydrogenase accessory sulfurtransferase FdhD [Terrihalobacillus insolitus]MDC3424515.1 formate dehydrogenase accessory sulfurtransferase FdhD [Terrihalobacillus insolitus]